MNSLCESSSNSEVLSLIVNPLSAPILKNGQTHSNNSSAFSQAYSFVNLQSSLYRNHCGSVPENLVKITSHEAHDQFRCILELGVWTGIWISFVIWLRITMISIIKSYLLGSSFGRFFSLTVSFENQHIHLLWESTSLVIF